jgi:hypothetical protein
MADVKDRTLNWVTVYRPGELLVKGYKDGNEISHYTIKTAGEPYEIKAVSDKNSFYKNKKQAAHIEINILDRNGTIVYDAENEITVTMEGSATLLGLESGSIVSHEDYTSNKRKVLHGKLLAYIESTKSAGAAKVTITSPGLKEQVITLVIR